MATAPRRPRRRCPRATTSASPPCDEGGITSITRRPHRRALRWWRRCSRGSKAAPIPAASTPREGSPAPSSKRRVNRWRPSSELGPRGGVHEQRHRGHQHSHVGSKRARPPCRVPGDRAFGGTRRVVAPRRDLGGCRPLGSSRRRRGDAQRRGGSHRARPTAVGQPRGRRPAARERGGGRVSDRRRAGARRCRAGGRPRRHRLRRARRGPAVGQRPQVRRSPRCRCAASAPRPAPEALARRG